MLMLLLLAACKKDGGNNYYLQADINGVTENFNTDAYAQEISGDITAAFDVTGKNDMPHQFFLSIVHTFNRVVKAGIYNNMSADSMYYPQMSYIKKDTINYSSEPAAGRYPLTITIAQLTDKLAAGTFSGKVYNRSNPSDSIVITNGKFYVSVKR